jgi:serine/threonine protein kinase
MTQSENCPGGERTRQSLIDEICSRFEEAWKQVLDQGGPPPQIDDYWTVPASQIPKAEGEESGGEAQPDRELLINLALTDLEYRWRLAAKIFAPDVAVSEHAPSSTQSSGVSSLPVRPRVEDYVARYPALGPLSELPIDLIEEEFSVRHLFGDRPGIEEYVSRFGAWHPHLGAQLADAQKDLLSGRSPMSFPGPSGTVDELEPSLGEVQPGKRIRYVGDYELVEELGRGGMGVVYKARQISLNRVVAVKMILSGLLANEEAVHRFRFEAENAARLDHPGIVPIYEVGEHEGLHYFSMGYLEGESLSQKILDHPLPPREAAQIMAQAAETVAYAHDQRVIHRDLKPANILIDESGKPRITDFGLAKWIDRPSDVSRTGDVIGTPSYMPPEQATGHRERIDARSDVYSLGATLYTLLVGRPPFYADNPMDTCLQVIHQEPLSLRQQNPKIPRDLETICLKCLEKSPERRYQTAGELAAELKRFLAGMPIQARPRGRVERLWLWGRRRPLVAALLGLSAMLALVIMIGGPLWAIRETKLREKADAATETARLSLAERNLQAAQLAGERGQWRKSLSNLDEALRNGHPDPVQVNLERIKALRVLGEHSRWAEEICRLSQSKDLAGHQAELFMCQAALLRFEGKEEEGSRLIEQAIGRLPPAEEAYAQSLLADTSPKAADWLRTALELDHFHYAATVDLVGLLFCLGQREESQSRAEVAHEVFPEDPCFPAWLAMIAAVEGKQDQAQKWLKLGREQLAPAEAEMLEALVALLTSVGKKDLESSNPHTQVGNIVLGAFSVFLKSKFFVFDNRSSSALPESRLTVTRPAKNAGDILQKTILPGIFQILSKNHAKQIEQLDKVVKIHPEGTIQLLRGLLLASDSRWRESEKACIQATKTGAVLPRVKHWAYYNAAAAAAMQYDSTKQKEHLDRMWDHLRKFATTGQVTPNEVAALVPVLMPCEQYDLTRDLINAALRTQPGDHGMVRLRVKIEMLSAAQLYGNAKTTLGKNPQDVQANELRTAILKAMTQAHDAVQKIDAQDSKAKELTPPAKPGHY